MTDTRTNPADELAICRTLYRFAAAVDLRDWRRLEVLTSGSPGLAPTRVRDDSPSPPGGTARDLLAQTLTSQ